MPIVAAEVMDAALAAEDVLARAWITPAATE